MGDLAYLTASHDPPSILIFFSNDEFCAFQLDSTHHFKRNSMSQVRCSFKRMVVSRLIKVSLSFQVLVSIQMLRNVPYIT